jgi:hypothetical protein
MYCRKCTFWCIFRYPSEEECEGATSCTGEWFAGNWAACSTGEDKCGEEGQMTRKVFCIDGAGAPAAPDLCPSDFKPFEEDSCKVDCPKKEDKGEGSGEEGSGEASGEEDADDATVEGKEEEAEKEEEEGGGTCNGMILMFFHGFFLVAATCLEY